VGDIAMKQLMRKRLAGCSTGEELDAIAIAAGAIALEIALL